MAKTPRKPASRITPAPNPASPPAVATPSEDPYRLTVRDVGALSAQLGAASLEEVRLLTAAYTDEELIELGNDFATPRVTDDSLRVLGVTASFLQRAPAAEQQAVDLSLDVVRVAAWAAAEDARAHEQLRGATASERTSAAGAEAEAARVLVRARAEKRKLADTVRAVAQSATVGVAVTHALAPAAHGATSSGPDVSLELLIKEGRALLASKDPSVKRRALLFRLTPQRLDAAATLARDASQASTVLGTPKVKITQEKVDWWDGATIVILQTIVRAFQGARETHPGVPSVGFVSLRRRANAGAGIADPGDAPEPGGAGGKSTGGVP